MPVSLASIRAARSRIARHVHVTPTVSATLLGEQAGVRLWLKCESLQKTGSFKSRGALNAALTLDARARERGIVTVSAGNHAQALAWAARVADVRCTVVMPARASQSKVDASRGYGAEVILHGASSIEAFARAHEVADERGLTFVHPFDDAAVISGAGTVGLELMEQLSAIDAVVVPIGGGGLISGVVKAIKGIDPRVRVFGVEPEGAAAMRNSLDAGHPMAIDAIRTIADGLSAPMAGEITFPIVRDLVDEVVLVTDAEIVSGMRELLSRTKLLAEPAGAAATAAVLAGRIPVAPGSTVVCLLSGGNVDLGRLSEFLVSS